MLTVSFEEEMYSVNENDPTAEVCVVTNIGHTSPVEVVIVPQMKSTAEYPATRKLLIKANLLGLTRRQFDDSIYLILQLTQTLTQIARL